MKKFLDTALSPRLFAMLYLPWLALNMMTVVNVLDFTRYILILFAAWGVLICAKTFLFSGKDAIVSKNSPYVEKGMAVLIAMIALCLISHVINFKYGGFDSVGKLAYFALCILVLYSQHKSSKEQYQKTFLYASRTLLAVITPAMIASLIMFINLFHTRVVGRGGAAMHVGFAENRLYGVFSSPNVGGMYAVVLIWCALINIFYLKKSKLRPLWFGLNVLQIIIALCYISLSLSRGTYLSGAAFIAVFLLVRAPFGREAKLNLFIQAGIRIVSIALCLVISYASLGFFRSSFIAFAEAKVMAQKSSDSKKPSDKDEKPDKDDPDEEDPDEESGLDEETEEILSNLHQGFEGRVESKNQDKDITNKRASIWRAHLSQMKGKEFFLGLNNPYMWYLERKDSFKQKEAELNSIANDTENALSVREDAKEKADSIHEQWVFIEYAKGNLHNGFFNIFVHCGIFALGALVLFIGICFARTSKYLVRSVLGKDDAKSNTYKLFSLAVPMVVSLLVNNVTETNIALMGANIFQAVFWFAAGAVVFCLNQAKKERTK